MSELRRTIPEGWTVTPALVDVRDMPFDSNFSIMNGLVPHMICFTHNLAVTPFGHVDVGIHQITGKVQEIEGLPAWITEMAESLVDHFCG